MNQDQCVAGQAGARSIDSRDEFLARVEGEWLKGDPRTQASPSQDVTPTASVLREIEKALAGLAIEIDAFECRIGDCLSAPTKDHAQADKGIGVTAQAESKLLTDLLGVLSRVHGSAGRINRLASRVTL